MKIPAMLAALMLLFLLSTCRSNEKPPQRAFYHWETELDLRKEELAYLQTLGVTTLYTRFFDVDLEEGAPVPLAEIRVRSIPPGMRIVPAIFITNRTMREVSPEMLPQLAEQMVKKTEALAKSFGEAGFDELHLDCDWTEGTREKYFALLREIRIRCGNAGRRLSVTLRLHQWKYAARTGIPPADLAVLMCYNTGNLERWDEPNSILSTAALQPYLSGLKRYPLPLGIAMPVFRWAIIFRDGQLIRLIHGLGEDTLRDSARFAQIDRNRFLVKKSTYLEGHYLYQGDRIRLESADAQTGRQVARMLRPALRKSPPEVVALFHIEPSLPQRIPHENTEQVFKAFIP